MLKKDLIFRNSLKLMGQKTEDILPEGGFGAVLARAGVGKTAFLVQLAINSQLNNKNVLHISLNDPVQKVSLWYKEVFRNIVSQNNLDKTNHLWETILKHRFIMTFKVDSFSVPKLEERLADLTEQDIFSPHMVVIDGLPFDKSTHTPPADLIILAKNHGLHIWLAVRTHRHEEPGPKGIPAQLKNVDDLFEVVILLHPKEGEIQLKVLKGGSTSSVYSELLLDPATMLIKNKAPISNAQ